jgi:succinoglycan biosynthesis transport protein ExoP
MTLATEENAPPLFDLGATIGVLWARRLVIFGVALGVFLAACAYVAVTKPVYTATATILLDPRDSRATGFDNVLPGIGPDSAAISSQVAVIASTELLGQVFESEGLANDPEFASRGLLSRLLGRNSSLREGAFDAFRSKVSVEREGLTYVIDVSFKSTDREKAARIVNAIVARYKATLAGEKESANSEANDLLTGKVEDLEKAVSDAEREVQEFKFQNQIFDASAGGTLQSQIDQFSAQLVTAQDLADQAEVKYQQAVAARTGPEGLARLSKILSSSTTDKLRDDYNQRSAVLANSRVVLGPKHPTIARLSAELAGIRDLMSSEAARIVEELKAQRDIARQNVAQIQAKLDRLREKANASDLAQVKLRQLQRKADAARSVLDDFLRRSQQTLHMEGLQISQVRVINEALPPLQATWPKPKLILPTSAVLGLMLGCAVALLLGTRPNAVAAGQGATPPSRPRLPRGWLPRRIKPARRTQEPLDLGVFKIPASSGASRQGSILSVRTEVAEFRNVEFLESVDRLLEELTSRLQDHAKPYVLRISALSDCPERRVAGATIGIALERIRQRVLVIDVWPRRSAGGGGRDSLVSALPFSDPTSGLRTINVGSDVLAERADAHVDDVLGRLLMRSGNPVDFLLVLDRPLDETEYRPALAARADLSIFALQPAEAGPDLARRLGERLSSAELERSATMVVDMGEAPTASAQQSARPAFTPDGRRFAPLRA